MKLSTDQILSKVLQLASLNVKAPAKALDIGAGTGALIDLLHKAIPGIETHACDYTDTLMQRAGQKVDIADLNNSPLPYESARFDLVTCTEVVEHLENYHRLVREIFRVTKPGGLAIFSTPNILNLHSRTRFLTFGFWNLFGPLHVGRAEAFSTVGHINPVSYFYLAHALAEAGFELDELEIDKVQRSAVPKYLLFALPIAVFSSLAKKREISRYGTINSSNAAIVDRLNSRKMLLGRTIIVVARKPKA